MRRWRDVLRLAVSIWFVLVSLWFAGCPPADRALAETESGEPVRFTLAVKSSRTAQYETSEAFSGREWSRAWSKAKEEATATPSVLYTDAYVEMDNAGAKRQFAMREDGVWFDLETGSSVTLPAKARKQWIDAAARLRQRHYGEMPEWNAAKSSIPLKTVVTVVDLETGLTFQAQRRAGSKHADVQPLTKKDTAVMKQIYGGTWSWKRRAILVRTGGRQIAASMHGMPHGGDGIPDNGFSGHFCIHFLGSSTHKSGKPDLAHQLMVHKAAGKLPDLLRQSTPEQLAESLFASLYQRDEALLRAVLHGASGETLQTFFALLQKAEDVRAAPLPPNRSEPDSVTAEVPVKATLSGRGVGKKHETFRLSFARETIQSPWVITGVEIGKKRSPS